MKKIGLIMCILAFYGCLATAQEAKLNPKEVYILMLDAVNKTDYKSLGTKRIDITKPFLKRVDTIPTNRENKFYLGEIYFWNFMPKPAFKLFSQLSEGNDKYARAAMSRVIIINNRAFKNFSLSEKMLEKYRKKFKPTIDDYNYLYGRTYEVANNYVKNKNHKKVIELIEHELSSLNYDAPYSSYLLPIQFFESYKKEGLEKRAIEIISNSKEALNETLLKRQKNKPKKTINYLIHTPRVQGMLTFVDRRLNYTQINEKFEKLIETLDKGLSKFSEDF